VAFRITGQFLGQRDQVLPLERRLSTFEFHLGSIMIAQTEVIGNLYYNFPAMKRALVLTILVARAS
jgi:hypothetical protein